MNKQGVNDMFPGCCKSESKSCLDECSSLAGYLQKLFWLVTVEMIARLLKNLFKKADHSICQRLIAGGLDAPLWA